MAGNIFGKMAADTLGLSDIGKIIDPNDFNKVDGDDYIMNEDGEKIYFVIKSKSDEYVFTNRGLIDRPNLYVLKHTKMPACLIEYGFISNKTEAARMKANTSVYGKALYNAVVNLMKKEGRY